MNPKINPPIIILYLSLFLFALSILVPDELGLDVDTKINFVFLGMFIGCFGTIIWMIVQLRAIKPPKKVEKIRICSCGKPLLDLLDKEGKKIGVTHTAEDEDHHFSYWSTEEVQNRIKNN